MGNNIIKGEANMKKIVSVLLTLVMMVSIVGSAFATATTTATSADINPFSDIADDSWYKPGVLYCNSKGLMSGTSKTIFNPTGYMTRGMMAVVMYRAAGQQSMTDKEIKNNGYTDVPSDAYYAAAVTWAKMNGVMSGYSDTKFGPNDNITREQIVTILYRYMAPAPVKADNFADEDKISPFAIEAVDWARANNIVGGKGGNMFDPQGLATRAEVATILYRFIEGI